MPRPNVLVFFTDQQRHDSTGLHGNPLDLTPNFDRVASAGTFLPNSFTCQPVCGPARACLQTGQYQNLTGCFRNGVLPPPGTPMLGHRFADAGYDTAYLGKWHLGDPADAGPVRPDQRGGYRHWLASNLLEFTSDPFATTVYDDRDQPVFLPGHRVDALTDAAIRYVADPARRDRPFFLFLSHLEPHFQNRTDDYPAPPGYAQRYASHPWTPPDLAALGGTAHQHLPGYWGMVKRLDEAFGRLLDALRSLGLLDNTIVLFTSDHACHFKTRNSEYKRSCHDASIRVPTCLTGPGFTAGGQLPHLVSLVDLPPTLLDAAGLPVPPEMQGRSLMPVVRRQPAAADWPDDVFVQISESQIARAVRTSRWKYCVTAPADLDPWRHAASPTYAEHELYDLESDPYELHNLIGSASHDAVAARLRQRLLARLHQAGEPTPTITPAARQPHFRQVLPAEIDA